MPSLLRGTTLTFTFEDLPDTYFYNGGDQNIGNYYAGVTFGPDVTGLSVSRFGGYDSSGFPPHSGDVVIWDATDPTITISFSSAVDSFGIWYTSFDPLTLKAFDSNGNLLDAIIGTPNTDGTTGTTSYLSLDDPDIASVSFTSTPGYYTLDDMTTEPRSGTPTPEPSPVALLTPLLVAVVTGKALKKCMRRRNVVQAVFPYKNHCSCSQRQLDKAFKKTLRFCGASCVLFILSFAFRLQADTPVINDTATRYSIGIQYASAPCVGTCDLSPSYNHYQVSSPFSISRITFNWYNYGGNNCDGFGHYGAIISSTDSASGVIASSKNNVYLGCVGFEGGTSGTGELDFAGQVIPASLYLDFLSVDGGVQGGAGIVVYDVEIWQLWSGSSVNFGPPSTANPTGFTSEPINTATGNYYLSYTDLTVPAKGLAMTFTRYYNSLDAYVGPFGVGWTHSYNIALTVVQSGVSLKDSDGHVAGFTPLGGGNYAATAAGIFDILTQNSGGTFTLTRRNQTKLNFSSSGILTSIVDRNGNTQTLNYASGNLISLVDTAGRTFIFAYDGSGRIMSLSDPIGRSWRYAYDTNDNLISVRDPLGDVTQYSYDANHHMTSATDARGITFLQNSFDTLGRVVNQTNARGFATTLSYNSPSAGVTTITDPLGNGTQHVYGGALRLVQVIDAKGGVVSYSYDSNNDRTSVTNQNGNTTRFSYDGQGNTTSITDALGSSKMFTYDAQNDLLTATNPKGATTTFTFDAKGNLLSIKDALADATSFAYTSAGQVTTRTDARGNKTTYAYDSAGNLIGATDPLGDATSFTYDGIGRLIATTDANGHAVGVTYDASSRIAKTTDALHNGTQFAYDLIGNLLTVTDANDKTTNYSYDATNNLITVTDALGGVTRYGYDANNNRTSFTNAKANPTTYTYDALNRLIKITDPLSFGTSYAYDAVGNATSTTDANGNINQYGYDALNRLVAGNFADGSTVSYSYDNDGNRASMSDWRGITWYAYDALNRVLSVTSPGTSAVQYSYDAAGNRTSLGYPDGRSVQYQYDVLNRLSGVTDWAGKSIHYSYDPVGNLSGFAFPNGAYSIYSYDAANRLLQIVNKSGSQVLSSFAYGLDNVGNRVQVTSAAAGMTKYGYDALYRLTSWTVPSGQVTQYNYDAVSNRTLMVSSAGTTGYNYDAAARMLSAGATSYTYDKNGNQITKTTGSTAVSYAYDALNRLITASGGGINSQYRYDGDGNRVSQSAPTGTYEYMNDTATSLPVVLNENGPDGNIDYLYGLSMISETSSAFQYFYQSDGIGSAASLTDATGALKASYAYDPWGKLTTPIDPLGTKNKYKFAGQPLDPTNYYFLRARYYDPSTGRLPTPDPIAGSVGLPISSNAYQYALANPVRLIDPGGYSAVDSESSDQNSGNPAMSSQNSAGRGLAKAAVTCIFDALTGGCVVGYIASRIESGIIDLLAPDKQTQSDIKLLLEPSFFNSSSQTVPAQMRLIEVEENKLFPSIGNFLIQFPHLPGL